MYLLNRNGIYYYQRVTMCNGRRQTFRKSLKTRDRAHAQLLALQIHFNHSSPDVQQAVCISDAACRDVMSKPVGFEAEASTTQHPPAKRARSHPYKHQQRSCMPLWGRVPPLYLPNTIKFNQTKKTSFPVMSSHTLLKSNCHGHLKRPRTNKTTSTPLLNTLEISVCLSTQRPMLSRSKLGCWVLVSHQQQSINTFKN